MSGEVILVGGGPSLRAFDWSLLEGRYWIGVNQAFVHGPRIVVSKDARWMEAYAHDEAYRTRPGARIYVGERFTCPDWVEPIKPRLDWSRSIASGLCAQADTGLTALNLADLIAGPDGTVLLLGFDFSSPSGFEENWHEAYPWKRRHARVYKRFRRWWERFVPDLQATVIDGTEGGQLGLFETTDGVEEIRAGFGSMPVPAGP